MHPSMPMLHYRVDPAIFSAHPGYRLGVVVVDGADNSRSSEPLAPLLRDAEAAVRNAVTGDVAAHPAIAAWREAYRRFGARPSEHRSSIEAMVRRVLKPAELPAINVLVDIGNIVSLRHRLPAGVHPLVDGTHDIALRPAAAGDHFTPADGGADETPPPGEVVLARGTQVLTRRWTWRQAAGTQTLPQTTRVLFNIDGLPPVDAATVQAAMDDVAQLVQQHTGGRIVARAVLTVDQPELVLS